MENRQPRILYVAKLLFVHEGKVNKFLEKDYLQIITVIANKDIF